MKALHLAQGGGVAQLVLALVMFFGIAMLLVPFGYFVWLWQQGLRGGACVPLVTLVGMKLRRVPAGKIVHGLVFLRRHGVTDVAVETLEAHYLAGGHIKRTCQAIAAAHEQGLPVSWQQLMAVDLAGQDPMQALRDNVGPDGRLLAPPAQN